MRRGEPSRDGGAAAICRRPVRDTVMFVGAWLRHPARTGAVLPSGARLARAITAGVGPTTGPVLELGSGTGVFTRRLLQCGVAPADLTLIESNPAFVARLGANFPGARVLQVDARDLAAVDLYPESRRAGAVICGLPLLAMPADDVATIVRGAFRQLADDGVMQLFTYAPRCPVPRAVRAALGLHAVRIRTVFANVPPAHVYVLSRVAQPAEASLAA